MRGIRFLVLGLVAVCVVGLGARSDAARGDGYVPPATPPPEFQATFDEIAQTMTAFEAELDAEWDGSVGPGKLAGSLSVANGNKSVALLLPATWNNVIAELDAYEAMGVEMIKLDVEYPVFTAAFHTYLAAHPPPQIPNYSAILDYFIGYPTSFYNRLVTEIRSRGLGVWIEYGTLFADYSSTPPGEYFADIRSAGFAAAQTRYVTERAAESALIVSQLKPDYFTILEEPSTNAMNFGYFPGEVPILSTAAEWSGFVHAASNVIVAADPTSPTLLGAGAGVWEPEDMFTAFASLPELDFIDLHIYPMTSLYTNYLQDTLDLIDTLHTMAPGKKLTMGETWAYKESAQEVSDELDFNVVLGRDVWSFWEPIDRQFHEMIFALMHYAEFDAVMPFWAQYYFAYLTHGDPELDGLGPIELLSRAGTDALPNIYSQTLTGLGEKFAELAAVAPDADGDGTPDSADSSDTDGDGVADMVDTCPLYNSPWAVPAGDGDCDGFPDSAASGPPLNHAAESAIGTTHLSRCAVTATANDEPTPDAWPVDNNDSRLVSGPDLLAYGPVFGAISPNAPYSARFDLSGDGRITGPDLLKFGPFFGKSCS